MQKLTVLFLLIATIVACHDPPQANQPVYIFQYSSLPIPEKVMKAHENTVGITIEFNMGNRSFLIPYPSSKLISSGSGFFTKKDLIVSARHIFMDSIINLARQGLSFTLDNDGIPKSTFYSYRFYGTTPSPESPINFPLKLISMGKPGEHRDSITLRAENYPKNLKILRLAENVKPGDLVYISGYVPVFSLYPNIFGSYETVQSDTTNELFEGRVKKIINNMPINQVGVNTLYKIEGKITLGYSGGPVFNTDGEVVGMAIEYIRDANFIYVLSSKDIKVNLGKIK